MTDLHPNSKLDTVLLCDATLADLFVDHSQEGVSLADYGTYYFDESPSPRTAIAAPREVSVIFDMATGNTGTLLDHSNGTTIGYRMEVVAGSLRCVEGGTIRVAIALSGIVATARKLVAQWSCFRDGANVRSELTVYNFGMGTWQHAAATHSLTTPNTAHTFTLGSRFSGSQPFANIIHVARIGARFHSQAEALEDWVNTSAPPSVGGERGGEGTPVDRSTGIGDHGAFAGPAATVVARATANARRRLLSPTANIQAPSPLVVSNTAAPAAWHTADPRFPLSRMLLTSLISRVVEPTLHEAWVRAHVLLYTVGAGVVPVYVRAFAFDVYPSIHGEQNVTPVVFSSSEVTVTTDHGVSGVGEWITLGRLPVPRDKRGRTRFCIGYDINHGIPHANLASTRFSVRAIVIDPLPIKTPGGIDVKA